MLQTVQDKSWYRGSADAVRRNLEVLLEPYKGEFVPDDVLVLSGQALYNMVRSELFATWLVCGALAPLHCSPGRDIQPGVVLCLDLVSDSFVEGSCLRLAVYSRSVEAAG